MEPRYRTPQELADGLQGREPEARHALWRLLREPVSRLMRDLVARNRLDADPGLFAVHALHAIETSIRVQPPAAFTNQSWGAFRAAQLVSVARYAVMPHGTSLSNGDGPTLAALPEAPGYRSGSFFRPYSRIGGQFFGGDWYAGRQLVDGSLWVFLADVTGHGYFAYLLASALPAVWQRCWNAHPGGPPEPAELLATMHDLIADSLPDGIFLEATLVRLSEGGEATIVSAGCTQMLHRGGGGPEYLKLRGAWLGLRAPTTQEQHRLSLGEGEELVLATDGAYDQIDEEGGAEAVCKAWHQGSVFEVLRALIERSLKRTRQKDDITLLMLERQAGGAPAVLRFPGKGA